MCMIEVGNLPRALQMNAQQIKTIGRTIIQAMLLLVIFQSVVSACPNCKDAIANDPAAQGLVRGYFYSILFMLSAPILIFSGLSSYFYWEICRARALQQAQALANQTGNESSEHSDTAGN